VDELLLGFRSAHDDGFLVLRLSRLLLVGLLLLLAVRLRLGGRFLGRLLSPDGGRKRKNWNHGQHGGAAHEPHGYSSAEARQFWTVDKGPSRYTTISAERLLRRMPEFAAICPRRFVPGHLVSTFCRVRAATLTSARPLPFHGC